MSRQVDLLGLSIAQPCTESWSEMERRGNKRHCEECSQDVHDLASMTSREIEHLVFSSGGHLCARLVRDGNGAVRSKADSAPQRTAWILAGVLASAGHAVAQRDPQHAVVSGRLLHAPSPNEQVLPRTVRFVQNGVLALQTSTDEQGEWHVELPPGTYDVIFGGPIFGERVENVVLHPGPQQFGPVTAKFNLGHLGLDREPEQSATVGAMVATISGMNLRYAAHHPLSYIAMLGRRLARVL